MTEATLQAEGLAKRFGTIQAVDGVDLRGEAGEVLALLGPNGAGKTTLVDILTGLRTPDSGSVRVCGEAPGSLAARAKIGVMPQNVGFPRHLKVREILDLVAAHFSDPLPPSELADDFLLGDLMDRMARGLSGGEMRRVALAASFAGRPKALFLDEPTTGLDVESRRSVWRGIRAAAEQGALVILTTHYLEEAAQLATRVAVIENGRIVLEDTPDGVRKRLGLSRLSFRVNDDAKDPPLPDARRERDTWVLDTADSDAAVRALVDAGIPFRDLEVGPASLEDAILALLGRR